VPAVVALATIVTFWPATDNDFVNWDDHRNFLQNRWYRGLGAEQIKWAFTTGLLGVYQPLSWIALSAQYVMFELDPGGYHAVSVLLHAATAVVFYFLVLRLLPLTIDLPGRAAITPLAVFAGIAAAAYALHPLRTEPVAWASSQPYVLAMLFYLLTLLFYVLATTERSGDALSWPWYAAAVVAYVCCLLSKAVGVMLPFVLLLMDVYPLRRIGSPRSWWGHHTLRIALEKLPFLALAIATAGLSVIATDTNAPMSQTLHGGHRMMLALFGLAFYVYKTLVPMNLLPLYPIPRPFDPLTAKFLIAAGLTVGLTICFLLLRRRFSGFLAAWAYYVLMLVPVLGIVQHGSQIAADRYAYLSCLVWPMLLAAGLLWLWRARFRGERAGVAFAPGVAMAVLAVAAVTPFTRAQTHVWRNSESLWTHVLSHEDTCDYAHNNLGTAVEAAGRAEEAVTHYRRAVEIEPLNIKARRNLGAALNRAGHHAEAEEQLRAAIKLAPGFANAHNSLGLVLDATGRRDEAIGHFKTAIAIGRRDNDPIAEPYINLANVYLLDKNK
jgi:Flp pilus assembly protein TadD